MEEPRTTLCGIRVITIAPNLPGPLAARRLLRMGATVIKVEAPGGDPAAAFPEWYAALNEGQHIVTLNLKDDAGRNEFSSLLSEADVLLSSMRPSAASRLGLYDMVERAGISHVEIVGDTEHPDNPGHDLTYQAQAGVLQGPDVPRVPWADVVGGERAATAALEVLLERKLEPTADTPPALHRRIGLKQGVDEAAEPFLIGATAPGQPLSGSAPQYGVYQTQDGWIALAAIEPHFHVALTALLGDDRETLEQQFERRTTAEWSSLAKEHDLPLVAVNRPTTGH